MGKKIKPKEVIKIACSECGAKLLVNKFEATVEPSKKAVKETWVTVEKDTQTKLPGEKKGK